MKTLNKYMVNRIAGLLAAAMDGGGCSWSSCFPITDFLAGLMPEPDMGEMKLLMERLKKTLTDVWERRRDEPDIDCGG